jgi:outer membrane protein OmpA-like peptidoglycan-associated protein
MFVRSLLGLALLAPAEVLAQDGFDAHGFNLAAFDSDVRDPLTVARPGAFQQNDWFFGGLLEYANEPLVYVETDAAGAETAENVVLDDLFALNLSLGWAMIDQVRFDVALPVLFTSVGGGAGGDPAATQGAGTGDLRLSAMIAPIQPGDEGGIGVGLVPYIDMPIGNATEFVGDGTITGGAKVAATYELERFTLGGEIGADFSPTLAALANLSGSDKLVTGIAVGVNPSDDLGFTLEGHLLSPFDASPQAGTGSPSEILFHGRKTTESGGHFAAGGAVAVSQGASAAEYRIFLGGGFGQHGPTVRDTDLDGLMDPVDACVNEPETMNAYKDEDGCPDGPGKLSVVVKRGNKTVTGAKGSVIPPEGGAGTAFTSAADPVAFDSFPGKVWKANATSGTCLAGEGTATMGEGPTELVVELQPVLDSTLNVEVRDPAGKMIETAQIAFMPESDGCAPSGNTPTPGGKGSAKVGAGEHEVRVSAPGYAIHTEQVQIGKAEAKTITVVLNPTRVQVTEKQIVILDVVYFETAKAIIKPESFGLLDEVATTIRTNPQLGRVEVSGHTDSQGSDSANLDLSQRRSESVREYLASKGVPVERIVAKGYGETKPIADNKTAPGRAKNRRVEFNLIDKAAPPPGAPAPAAPAPAAPVPAAPAPAPK